MSEPKHIAELREKAAKWDEHEKENPIGCANMETGSLSLNFRHGQETYDTLCKHFLQLQARGITFSSSDEAPTLNAPLDWIGIESRRKCKKCEHAPIDGSEYCTFHVQTLTDDASHAEHLREHVKLRYGSARAIREMTIENIMASPYRPEGFTRDDIRRALALAETPTAINDAIAETYEPIPTEDE